MAPDWAIGPLRGMSMPGIDCANAGGAQASSPRPHQARSVAFQKLSVVAIALAQVTHQLGERRFHLVLHLADQLILAHSDMVERL